MAGGESKERQDERKGARASGRRDNVGRRQTEGSEWATIGKASRREFRARAPAQLGNLGFTPRFQLRPRAPPLRVLFRN